MSLRDPALWLNELSELSGRFKDLLERELAHLSNWPVLNLPDFAQAKTQLSRQLECLESERVQWLSSQGQRERGRLAMREALHALPNGSQLLHVWEHAVSVLKACQPLNQQAGLSISLLGQQTRRSLDILTGNAALPATYGKQGQQSGGYLRGSLGQA
ncbi:FlgN protein [Paraperlucidibaca baekdonensis]|uniref:FlgN protein n=1 Tax=Paraperlucidibaca baekdonensis TaxID=748120 RepID=A0A3E0H389_9GAMM|nr:flagellar protein FlgN [Paraperlucidibaca baekdonensis]REH36735.1 FlgN protein [Paraperlucidibaca baekdonensis]